MPPVNTPTVQVPAFSAKQGAILDVLPPALPSARLGFSGKKPEANLSGTANDFQDLEQSRKLTFCGDGARAEVGGAGSPGTGRE